MVVDAILDASALLTLLQREPGSERVAELIGRCGMSAVSLAEVSGSLHGAGLEATTIVELLDLSIDILPFDTPTACIAGKLLPLTQHHGLSLSDRCSLATAFLHYVPVVTSERQWGKLRLTGIDIEVVQ